MKNRISYLIAVIMIGNLVMVPSFADKMPKTDLTGFSPIEAFEKQEGLSLQRLQNNANTKIGIMASQGNDYTIPGGKGTLTSNAWRSSVGSEVGHTLQWDYQVSAVYSGNYQVESIRTTWQGSASLRNSASISLGLGDTVQIGASSSWANCNTVTKYYENSNGAKSSDYGSNMIVTPAIDYRWGTISIINTAKVKLKGDPKPYSISAGA